MSYVSSAIMLLCTVLLICIVKVKSQSSECASYTTINDPTRKDTYAGGSACDDTLATNWYRFTTPGSTMMPQTCVSYNHCGTAVTGWLSGQHPTVAQGIVTRKVCYHYTSSCCDGSQHIRVRNCGAFFVYELKAFPTNWCHSRFCTTAITEEDECTSGTHNCHAHANCENILLGSFTCTCKPGYIGDGVNCAVVKIFCLDDRFGMTVEKRIPPFTNASVTLKDTSCTATSNATHFYISTSFTECGSSINATSDHIVLSNTVVLQLSNDTSDVITRDWSNKLIAVTFSCNYKRSELEGSLKSFKPKINHWINTQENGFGSFILNISMARNASFDSYFVSYPVTAKANERLYIQVSLNTNNTAAVLIIEECYATPTWNKNNGIKYTMIKKMCPTDSTLKFHSGENHHKKFSFVAFNFLNNLDAIYLHCGVYLCLKSSTDARCISGCGTNRVPASRTKRDVQKREIGDPAYSSTYILDTGEIQKDQQNEEQKGTSLSSVSTTTIVLGVAVGLFCLLFISFIVLKTIKRDPINCIKRNQPQTVASFGKEGLDNKAIELDQSA